MKKTSPRISSSAALAAGILVCALAGSGEGFAAAPLVDYRDALDRAIAPPEDIDATQQVSYFEPFVGDDFAYDSNLYRLPANITNLSGLPGIGADPTRDDYINSVLGGVSAQWLVGSRQNIDLNLVADDNRYAHNTDLDNISTNDSLVWNWGLGSVFSGEAGASYTRASAGFTNTGIYSLSMVSSTQTFAGARYQVGPHWAVFGGVLGTETDLSNAQPTYNDSRTRAVDVGADYATSASNSFGIDYRYTDARYPNAVILSNQIFDPDYREDRARFIVTYALSEKTVLDGYVGYLRREYPSTALGNYSGEIWRASLQWEPTEKTQLMIRTWRALDADYTAQTDYFVDRGVSFAPYWFPTAKLSLSLTVLRGTHDYIGANPGVIETQQRKDTITSEMGGLTYTATRSLTLTLSGGHETRDSNLTAADYKDFRGDANLTFKFGTPAN
jgi:hypothetical protein